MNAYAFLVDRKSPKPKTGIAASGSSRRRFSTSWLSASAAGLLLITGILLEAKNSYLQSLIFPRVASALAFEMQRGASESIRFPSGGPYDERLGYKDLPAFISGLKARGFSVTDQAHWSPELQRFAGFHGYAMYREKPGAGLALVDRSGAPLYSERYPKRSFENFHVIPPIVVDALRFVEDRSLLDPRAPRRNPAVDWHRFALAAAGQVGGKIDPRLKQGGGSTLATQIEKFRHYPGGRTRTAGDKFSQMLAASIRSYVDGPQTVEAQQQIIIAYLNSTPLGSRPGYGEVFGLADGLWAWFGTDIDEINRVLVERDGTPSPRRAELFKQTLSLILAERRPSYYLLQARDELAELTDRYLNSLADAGVIDRQLRDAARGAELAFLKDAPPSPPVSFVSHKAATSIRKDLLGLLGIKNLHDLDRLDVAVSTTIDAKAQQRVTNVLADLGNREQVKSLGLVGPSLLGAEDPSKVAYSFVLYERGADRNALRVRADSLNQPFDLNSGAKLILGSTAKLRTLLTYLDIIDRLHSRLQHLPAQDLAAVSVRANDPLTRWAAAQLAQSPDRSLQTMLDAAMARRYSANPRKSFFTGGGVHVFGNYDSADDGRMPTVEEALVHSVNLAFIRIMRDIRDFYIAERERSEADHGEASRDRMRLTYLQRFADQEGSTFLSQFYRELRGRSPDEMLSLLASKSGNNANRLTILFRSLRPDAGVAELGAFLSRSLPSATLSDDAIGRLYETYAADRYSLNDRAYLARVHPLQLWLAAYLNEHQSATRNEILAASKSVRQETYGWLFNSSSRRGQDTRIRIISEQAAFENILEDWRKQGYPFAQLVPSLATAIGSSGDRPDALAELMGIILNDGLRFPTADIERIDFAHDTPYETRLELRPKAPERVFSPEVARIARRALSNVVSEGTGARFRGVFKETDGTPIISGGKTGTGDNREKVFGAGHTLMESRAIDRTATFVFFLGDRFYGTITAYVAGPDAAKYHFTSALAVQLLKSLAPELQPLIASPVIGEVAGLEPHSRDQSRGTLAALN